MGKHADKNKSATNKSIEEAAATSTAAKGSAPVDKTLEAPVSPNTNAKKTALSESLARKREARLAMRRRMTAQTRLIAIIPALGFFITALVLSIGTLIRVIEVSLEFMMIKIDVMELAIDLVEYADLFLLAVVLYILALGLITLFVTDHVPLPSWLTFNDFDDLKERLVSVINVMLGVYFLGVVLNGAGGINILWLGLACAVVIVALTLFVKLVIQGHEPEPEPEPELEPEPQDEQTGVEK